MTTLTAKEAGLRVLVVDDEELMRETVRLCLDDGPYRLTAVSSAEQATRAMAVESFDLALVDLRLGTRSGLDLIPRLREASPRVRIVLITAHGSVETAVAAMRLGVMEFLEKPFRAEVLREIVDRVAVLVRDERAASPGGNSFPRGYSPLLDSRSPPMRAALALAETVARSDATVLLRGPSGTGKGVLARAIHRASPRRDKPFAVVHCPSLSDELLNSELFGHVRGAFTGAVSNNEGMIAAAEGGTVLLDEIGELPMRLQPKLLRFLQDREYQRVGDSRTFTADVRVIAATNTPLEHAVEQKLFREDLFHRLNVFPIDIPPLETRREDIPHLAHLFLVSAAARYRKDVRSFTDAALQFLSERDWPGNVRELENVIERAVILAQAEVLDTADFQGLRGFLASGRTGLDATDMPTLEEMEKRYIRFVLEQANSIEESAEILDISTPTLWRRRRKYGL